MKEESSSEEITFMVNGKEWFYLKKDSDEVNKVLDEPTKEGLRHLFKKELIYERRK